MERDTASGICLVVIGACVCVGLLLMITVI
jgi:hypothetical protein